MPTEAHGELTTLLGKAAAGDETAKRELFERVYDELHKRARARMIRERVDHTWGATDLVHAVYVQLVNGRHVFTKNRAYFFGAAARAMHQLLREHARWRAVRPEGHLDSDGALLLNEVVEAVANSFPAELIDLRTALTALEATGKQGPRRAAVVKLRIWDGLTHPEISEQLRVPLATVEKDWRAARAWLYGRLKGRDADDRT